MSGSDPAEVRAVARLACRRELQPTHGYLLASAISRENIMFDCLRPSLAGHSRPAAAPAASVKARPPAVPGSVEGELFGAHVATPNIPKSGVKTPKPNSREEKLQARPAQSDSVPKERLKTLRRVVAGISGFVFGAAGGVVMGGAAGFLVGGLPGALIGAAVGGTIGAIGGAASAAMKPTAMNATLGALVLPVSVAMRFAAGSGA